MNEPSSESDTRKPMRGLRKWLACSLLAIGLFLTVVYCIQPDHLVPVTMVPPWGWLFLFFIGAALVRHKILVFVFAIWLLFAILHVEELSSFLRLLSPTNNVGTVRVASLNCNVGNTKAALEALAMNCDVLLLQESPSLDNLAKAGFKDQDIPLNMVWSGDNSIVVRGQIEPVHVDPSSHFCHVLATLESGVQIDIVSLRLSAPVFRLDFWHSGFWDDHYQKRVHHREQLQQIVSHLREHQRSEDLIIGGDFNSVARDGAMATTLVGLADSFDNAGIGWGATGTNEFPIFRVDQIWGSRNLASVRCRIIKTENSDHRMVISDFELSKSMNHSE